MSMNGRRGPYIPGDHWVICDRCGFTYRNSQMTTEWTGLVVCKKYCFEQRHPQDFVRVKEEDTSAKGHVRPDTDVIESIGYVDAGYWDLGYSFDLPEINHFTSEVGC